MDDHVVEIVNRIMEYGLYNWWPKQSRPSSDMDELFDLMIHPDDLDLANTLNPMGKVFIKTGVEQKYLVIESGENRLRVTPEKWIPVTGDGLKIGDRVGVVRNEGTNTAKEGVVDSMTWHYKKEAIIYHISESGIRLKKRYFFGDIELL